MTDPNPHISFDIFDLTREILALQWNCQSWKPNFTQTQNKELFDEKGEFSATVGVSPSQKSFSLLDLCHLVVKFNSSKQVIQSLASLALQRILMLRPWTLPGQVLSLPSHEETKTDFETNVIRLRQEVFELVDWIIENEMCGMHVNSKNSQLLQHFIALSPIVSSTQVFFFNCFFWGVLSSKDYLNKR